MRILFTIILSFLVTTASAKGKNTDKNDNPVKVGNHFLDKQTQYGGKYDLIEYLDKEFKYPDETEIPIYPQYVTLKFIVGRTGKLRDIKVIKKESVKDVKLQQEVVRLFENMQEWSPAIYHEKEVAVYHKINYQLPFKRRTLKDVDPEVFEEPLFPGGQDSLYSFLAKNLVYPVECMEQGVQGTVRVRFKVSEYGDIEQVEAVLKTDTELDNAAVELIKKMPKWIPALSNGKVVETFYTIPIRFRIN